MQHPLGRVEDNGIRNRQWREPLTMQTITLLLTASRRSHQSPLSQDTETTCHENNAGYSCSPAGLTDMTNSGPECALRFKLNPDVKLFFTIVRHVNIISCGKEVRPTASSFVSSLQRFGDDGKRAWNIREAISRGRGKDNRSENSRG